jgi:predicted RNA-binding Zn ribbon-like protein
MSADPKDTLFDLCGGHPALDFVNSLDNRFREDGPNEMLASYSDLLRFLEETGLLSRQNARVLNKTITPQAAARVLQATRELREATAAVFYGSLEGKRPQQEDLRLLEKHFLHASRHRELEWESHDERGSSEQASPENQQPAPARLSWSWGRNSGDPDLPVWILALSVSDILLSPDMARVRTCAVHTCRWLFLDTSKNHTRRWCNMKVCGNRVKARRFQARRDQS